MNRSLRQLTEPLIRQNPVTLQILGICSALAVTTSLTTAMTLAAALVVVLAAASGIIAAIRMHIPDRIRLIVQITIISTLVVVADEIIQAFAFQTSQRLSIFVGLIVTNCLVLGRAESFAMHNRPWPSILDGIGNGLGYALILFVVAFIRELLGEGTLFGVTVFRPSSEGGWYEPLGLMALAPSAFFILGLLIWAIRTRWSEQIERPELGLREMREVRR